MFRRMIATRSGTSWWQRRQGNRGSLASRTSFCSTSFPPVLIAMFLCGFWKGSPAEDHG
jgi:hypothetical protein